MSGNKANQASGFDNAKRPATFLSGPYGHPMHPLLVTVPIGAWLSAFIFDLFAYGTGEAGYVAGAQLLVAIGVIGAVIAAIFGLMDLVRIPGGTAVKKTALTHMTINFAVVVVFVISFILQAVDGYDDVNLAAFILVILGLLALSVSGWLGGKMAYRFGVRVAHETDQLEAYK